MEAGSDYFGLYELFPSFHSILCHIKFMQQVDVFVSSKIPVRISIALRILFLI